MKVYGLIEHMTYSVDAIEGVRDAANQRAAKLPEKSALRTQLQQLASKCDELRSKIVATKEGGAITGEERIRELLGQLYGSVNNYEGRPTEYQAARAESLGHELEDVIGDFQKLTQKELVTINAGLKKNKQEAIPVLAETEWHKNRESGSGPGSGAGMRMESGRMWERD
jgi:sugar-specific transcriptional regulator TrmB